MIYAFTSCALNYTPKSKALLRSIRKHAPDIKFCLALGDEIRDFEEPLLELFDYIYPVSDFPEINDSSWIFKHNIVELCTAIKPFVLSKILERDDCEAVFYFDPDIVLFSDIKKMIEDVRNNNILLTPHLTDPEADRAGIEDNELSALKHGVFNLGYIGVKKSDEGRRFVKWWSDRLKDYCREDIPSGIFTDQKWIDLVPCLFDGVKILKNPGYNVASWNLTNRKLVREGDETYSVNGEPLVFYHFTGFDSGSHMVMAKIYSKNCPAVKELIVWYSNTIAELAKSDMAKIGWAFGSYEDGSPISQLERRVYRERLDLQHAFPEPFETENYSGKTYKSWWQKTGKFEFGEEKPAKIGAAAEPEYTPPKKRIVLLRLPKLVVKIAINPQFRKNVFRLITSTFRFWGLKGVLRLFVR